MRLNMLLVFIVIGIVPLSFFSYVVLKTYEDKAIENRVKQLQGQANMLSNLLLPTNLLANSDAPEIDKEINRISEIYDGRIIIVNNSLTIGKIPTLEEGKYLVSRK